jgi:hypothetical protein
MTPVVLTAHELNLMSRFFSALNCSGILYTVENRTICVGHMCFVESGLKDYMVRNKYN